MIATFTARRGLFVKVVGPDNDNTEWEQVTYEYAFPPGLILRDIPAWFRRKAQESLVPNSIQRIANSDIIGNDLGGMPIRRLTVAECEQECAIRTECRAFTFNKPHLACFLKSDGVRIYTNSSAQSGYKVEIGDRLHESTLTITEQIDLQGGDYQELNSPELGRCADVCEKDDKCSAFTYAIHVKKCWLKTNVQYLVYTH